MLRLMCVLLPRRPAVNARRCLNIGMPAQLGLRTADVTDESLCNVTTGGNGSIGFSFHHEEPGKEMHGSHAVGKVSASPRIGGRLHVLRQAGSMHELSVEWLHQAMQHTLSKSRPTSLLMSGLLTVKNRPIYRCNEVMQQP